jgi:hypothetical protein
MLPEPAKSAVVMPALATVARASTNRALIDLCMVIIGVPIMFLLGGLQVNAMLDSLYSCDRWIRQVVLLWK